MNEEGKKRVDQAIESGKELPGIINDDYEAEHMTHDTHDNIWLYVDKLEQRILKLESRVNQIKVLNTTSNLGQIRGH